uniref:Uncharacterized protein n=1 Tax=Promethearchaeum syntrophicum TaxID=2594042 RepID=A0A5B9DFN0_9ARCH|nr:hypothetical protein DSAG12_03693 [Candidatus Prometheoarchaeum syntrophicum]
MNLFYKKNDQKYEEATFGVSEFDIMSYWIIIRKNFELKC